MKTVVKSFYILMCFATLPIICSSQIVDTTDGKQRVIEVVEKPFIKSNFEGKFKGHARPWEGLYYIYSGMKLIKVEIWKHGKYWADASLQTDSIDIDRENMDLNTLREYCKCSDSTQTSWDTREYPRDEIYVDGFMCGNEFWCGWMYEYDNDGILLRVKVFSKGQYIGDAKL